MRVLAACLILALAIGASTAATAASSKRQCFPAQAINGFTAVDRDTINVNVGASDVYQFELVGTCPNVDWASVVGMRARGGRTFICNALDVEVISQSPIGPQRCQVSQIRKLTEAEIAAMKGRPAS